MATFEAYMKINRNTKQTQKENQQNLEIELEKWQMISRKWKGDYGQKLRLMRNNWKHKRQPKSKKGKRKRGRESKWNAERE